MTTRTSPTPRCRPGELAEALRRSTVEGRIVPLELRVAIAEFLDTFYLDPDTASRRARLEVEPAMVGDPDIDAFMGGVGEHLCMRWGLGPAPAWTDAPERFLRKPTFMGPHRMRPFMLMESPAAFRRRMIFTEAEPLRRARMPRDGRWWAYETLRTGLTPPDETEAAFAA